MNNTQKILVAVGVGVGVAYLYNRYRKGSTTKKTGAVTPTNTLKSSLQTPENAPVSDMTREEKEEFILSNVSATPQEVASGFEGTRFVWNPQFGRFWPVGTIVEGKEPAYVNEVFNSADGSEGGRLKSPTDSAVANAEQTLQGLNDQELDLLFQIVKKQQENPSLTSEEDAVKDMGVTNPNILKLVRQKLKKTLNDIKALKQDSEWNKKWNARKEVRKNRRAEFKTKMGIDRDGFKRLVNSRCGSRPKRGNVAEYKKCVENIANKIRSSVKNEIRAELSSAPVSVKEEVNTQRQESFKQQVVNRDAGGMFAGKRWDGESNNYIESLVDKGLV
jgi:hypothetical protein